jgi:hypothetical protein
VYLLNHIVFCIRRHFKRGYLYLPDRGLSLVARKEGTGGVARSRSAFLGAWSKFYEGITEPLIAEALVVRDGVIFARLRGYSKVVMEMDARRLFHSGTIAMILDRLWHLSFKNLES